jgi:N-acetylglutamate synthase-like GNAT family acetyltransferase
MRKWIDLVGSDFNLIAYSDERGAVEGYSVSSNDERVINWFEHRHKIFDSSVVEMLRTRFSDIAFLNNIAVWDDYRGEGYGADMLQWFEASASDKGAQAVVLLADTGEEQAEGFDLVEWYIKEGYERIPCSSSMPLMLKTL